VTENFEYIAKEGKHSFYRLEISIFFLLSFSIATSTSLSINYKVTILQGRIDHKKLPSRNPESFRDRSTARFMVRPTLATN
jgi:hypothetical protein